MTSLVVRKVRGGALRLVPVVPGQISQGVVKLEHVQVICPACGQQVEAVAKDGRVKGYCAVARQYVDFLIETQLERKRCRKGDPEYRARQSAITKKVWQNPEYRANQSAAQKKVWQSPEHRAKMSAILTVIMKKRWQDPEYRAKQIATRRNRRPV